MSNPTDREIAETLAGVLGFVNDDGDWCRWGPPNEEGDQLLIKHIPNQKFNKHFRSLDVLARVREQLRISERRVWLDRDGYHCEVKYVEWFRSPHHVGAYWDEPKAEALALYKAAKARGDG